MKRPMRFDGHRYVGCRWCHGQGCLQCEGEAKKACDAALAAGPIATIRIDTPEGLEKARALLSPDALKAHFGPGGGGMKAFEASLKAASDPADETASE